MKCSLWVEVGWEIDILPGVLQITCWVFLSRIGPSEVLMLS